jgi:protein-S-isoprenylcysteine O-methyltransferase Ste14
MSHATDHGDPTEAAKPKRFQFTLAQLLGIVLSLGLVMGTSHLVMANSSQPSTSIVAGVGFAAAALVFFRAINAKAT